jgi:4-hydroxythreonine-4-phosphate dehydrogenase
MPKKPVIGVTMGDPAGIGPEVVVKALTNKKVRQSCYPLVFGSYPIIFSAANKFLGKVNVKKITWVEDVFEDSEECINVLDCTRFNHTKVKSGKITKLSGRMAADCVIYATQFALSDQIDAIVTAPLSKKGLHLAGYAFAGHTEFLAYLTATQKFAMMFVSDRYKVVLVTTHLALSEVAKAISKKQILEKIILAEETLREYFGINRPKIGVCALNPHAGEEGIFGTEEKRFILPAIKMAQKRGIKAFGPYPADTIFRSVNTSNHSFQPLVRSSTMCPYSPLPTGERMKVRGIWQGFDCIVAMYHDQGLIPLKMAGLGNAVNVTIGLPIIRTSPDFGTALDIAGKGIADPKGMVNAILLAAQLSKIPPFGSEPSFDIPPLAGDEVQGRRPKAGVRRDKKWSIRPPGSSTLA